ncbi:MAG TPA: radical SAM protein [Spirochaetota bacterium]|mgnify:FL=1|nr:radical SAM protein [Spirochaetota bacterium]HOR43304.1 radical SAM protein [Spirochaetota bacterium]HPK54947.1 radical SAM protein [Spirochaetota bacterium]
MDILFEYMLRKNRVLCIVYDRKDSDRPVVKRFLALNSCEKIPYSTEDELSSILTTLKKHYDSKEVVVLKEFKGRFFQVCPKTPRMICCNYRLVNTGFGCFYNCAYCYLQSYLNSFGILVFSNIEDILVEFENFLNQRDKNTVYRIGTGEYTDSLMLDDISMIGRLLVERAAECDGVMIELKTKTDNIDHLLGIKNKGKSVVGFSLNSVENADKYELGAVSIKERIIAAKRAVDSGFLAAFHFDPIIYSPDWSGKYAEVLSMISDEIDSSKIAWISMGCFRYSPSFKDIIRKNHPDEKITLGELVSSRDGKFRYPHQLRREVYTGFNKMIKDTIGDVYTYMCMESDDMWRDVYNKDYSVSEDLEKDFSLAMRQRFFEH